MLRFLRIHNSFVYRVSTHGRYRVLLSIFEFSGAVLSCFTLSCCFDCLYGTMAQTTAALTRLKPVWNDRNISLSPKIRLMRSPVTAIFLYACESWTLTSELQRRIQAMKMRCYRKILHISYKDHVTNEEVRGKIQ